MNMMFLFNDIQQKCKRLVFKCQTKNVDTIYTGNIHMHFNIELHYCNPMWRVRTDNMYLNILLITYVLAHICKRDEWFCTFLSTNA